MNNGFKEVETLARKYVDSLPEEKVRELLALALVVVCPALYRACKANDNMAINQQLIQQDFTAQYCRALSRDEIEAMLKQ